uniref:Protein phosphatase methylesterase 1 n=1 Tax=Steinernema glaseri TaxID=37863 RepID=A0A1I7ZWP2_9BILA
MAVLPLSGAGPMLIMAILQMGAEPQEHTPIGWEEFFTAKVFVETENGDRFNVYKKGDKGPVFFLLHGGGYTGLTWSCFVEELTKNVECQVVAPDLRGHGETQTSDNYNLSVDQQLTDIKNIYHGIFPQQDNFPHCIIVGHSMGGALAVHACERELIPNTFALSVIDVVEGTAVAALKQMRTVLLSRPRDFPDERSAIDWACKTSACRNLRQARVSMPSQLKASSHHGLTWKIDLSRTEPHWPAWFDGLSQKFLKCKPTKMLILANVDRLDKDLTVAQMQGKFQQVVVPNCGHAVHEDAPQEVANLFVSLLHRYKVILEKNRKL